jgi:hypothetical protein
VTVDDPRRMGSVSHDGDLLSRRAVLARAGLLAAASALAPLPRVASGLGLLGVAPSSTDAVVRDTLGGLVAYVVPGDDRYSLAQGVSTTEPGGVAAGAVDALRSTLEIEGPGVSVAAAVILNARAQDVAPGGATRGFASAFAALSYARKDQVVRTLAQSHDVTLRVLGSTVPALAVFLSYSEAGVLDRRTRRLRGVPVGWRITGYSGVADIRNEFRGYYGGHRAALGGGQFE